MRFNLSKHFVPGLLFAGCLGFGVTAFAQELSIKSGESIDVHSVYWVRDCRSLLKTLVGVEILEGPPGITLTLREESVKTSARQNCQANVPGAMVVATAKQGLERSVGTLKYRVRYDTEEGQKQSSHSYRIFIYPQ